MVSILVPGEYLNDYNSSGIGPTINWLPQRRVQLQDGKSLNLRTHRIAASITGPGLVGGSFGQPDNGKLAHAAWSQQWGALDAVQAGNIDNAGGWC